MPRKFLVIIMSLLLTTTVASIFLGVKDISVAEVLAALFKLETAKPLVISVVHKRILRTCFALMCGAALGVSGILMQAVTRNPLADPSILGINSGASFFVVSGIAFLQITTAGQYIVLALLGAFVAASLVFGVVALGHKMSPLTLILSGTAVSIVFSSLVTTVVLVKQDALDSYRFWQVGSPGGASWHGLMLFLPILLLGIFGAVLCAPALNALNLGQEIAHGLGVNVTIISLLACVVGIILCAVTTALAGPIGFIGLLVTHFTRYLVGIDLKKMMLLAPAVGALFLLTADVIGRLLSATTEINVGIITALVGAPVLVFLARKTKVAQI